MFHTSTQNFVGSINFTPRHNQSDYSNLKSYIQSLAFVAVCAVFILNLTPLSGDVRGKFHSERVGDR